WVRLFEGKGMARAKADTAHQGPGASLLPGDSGFGDDAVARKELACVGKGGRVGVSPPAPGLGGKDPSPLERDLVPDAIGVDSRAESPEHDSLFSPCLRRFSPDPGG